MHIWQLCQLIPSTCKIKVSYLCPADNTVKIYGLIIKVMFRYSPLWRVSDCHNLTPHIWLCPSNCVLKQEYFICIQVPRNTRGIPWLRVLFWLVESGVKCHVTLEIDALWTSPAMVFNGKIWQLLKQLTFSSFCLQQLIYYFGFINWFLEKQYLTANFPSLPPPLF